MRTIESSDGVAVALHELGGQGPPLMICHATGFHARAYRVIAEMLADSFTVWGLDFRGHGASTPPQSEDFAWPGMADDLLACIDALGLANVTAFGHSMGATATLLAQLRRPGLITQAYLFEPIVFPLEYLQSRTENPLADRTRKRRASFESHAAVIERYSSRPPLNLLDPRALADYVEFGFHPADDGGVTLACLPDHEARIFEAEDKMHLALLDGLSMQAVIGAGAVGNLPSPAALAPGIAEAIAGAELARYEELGHFGPLQAPAKIAADALAFFERSS